MHAVDATDRLSVWAARRLRPAGRRRGPRRRQHLRRQRAAGGRHVGLGRLHRLRDAAVGAALGRRRADRADRAGSRPPSPARCPTLTVVETHATSADGTPVHLFVLSGSGTPDAPRPTVLYGYGGFNVSLTPAYTAQALAWVAAGGVWAVANLRGGSEHGEEWHRAGMRERKQNVFDDFAAAGEHLVAAGLDDARAARGDGRLQRRPAGRRHAHPAARPRRRRRLQRAAAGHGPLRAVRPGPHLERRVRHRRGPRRSSAGCSATRRTTRSARGRRTRRCCSRRSSPTPGSTRCTAASSPPPCSTPPPSDAPVVLRRETSVGHGARAVSRTVGLAADQLAFLAEHTGLARR